MKRNQKNAPLVHNDFSGASATPEIAAEAASLMIIAEKEQFRYRGFK